MRYIVLFLNVQMVMAGIAMLLSENFPSAQQNGFWAVLVAAITPVITISYLVSERRKKWVNPLDLKNY